VARAAGELAPEASLDRVADVIEGRDETADHDRRTEQFELAERLERARVDRHGLQAWAALA
jgi:hypothetical protein